MLQTLKAIGAAIDKQNLMLGSLLNGLAGPVPIDYFKLFLQKTEYSLDEFRMWRDKIKANAEDLGRQLARALAENRKIGFLDPPEVTPEELTESFANPNATFIKESFSRFEGAAFGDLRLYMPVEGAKPAEIKPPPTYSIWGPVLTDGYLVQQKITASNIDYVEPERLPPLYYGQTDLIYNAYRPDLGMVSWSVFFRNHNDQLRSIGYELDGRLMWINELVERDGHGRYVKENGDREFVISIDYQTTEKGVPVFNVYAVHTIFNLDKGTVRAMLPTEGPKEPMPEPRILEMKNVWVPLGDLAPAAPSTSTRYATPGKPSRKAG